MVRARFSHRHRRISTEYEVHLNGQLIVNDPTLTTPAQLQAAQAAKISPLIEAYKENYKDFAFYHDDGTKTRHSLNNADSISGVQVKSRSWPQGDQAEYATLRTYSIVLYAEYLDLESDLLFYRESLQFIGTGGPRWLVHDTWDGPVYQLLHQRTHQRVVQQGFAIGSVGYPLVDINPMFPDWEHVDRRIVTPGTPESYHNGYLGYPIEWAFQFSLPQGTNAVPLPR